MVLPFFVAILMSYFNIRVPRLEKGCEYGNE